MFEVKQELFDSPSHPQVALSKVEFLGDEIQIEQGSGKGDVELYNMDNDVISMSLEQAVEMAKAILKLAGE